MKKLFLYSFCMMLLNGYIFSQNKVTSYEDIMNQLGKQNISLMGENYYLHVNMMNIYQQGNGNSARLEQQGRDINTTTAQIGDYNSMDLSISGRDLSTKYYQYGNYNEISQDILVLGRDYRVLQLGDHNRVAQQKSNRKTIPGMKISQRGHHLQLIIK